MSSRMKGNDIAIRVQGLSKCFEIYGAPRDRLKQFVMPRLQRMLGQPSEQYFREFWALKDTSFEIKCGETVGIVGRNGSGKSTLLQIICGTLNPTGGTVETNGRIAALLELGSGFNPEFSGRDNVYLNASVLGLSKDKIDQRFDDIAAFADIGDFIDQPVKTYSSGMFVRLAFSVVAHVDAQILVIDEALAVGDAYFTQKCMRFLRHFREAGTLVFVSHDSSAVTGLCDSAIWLDGGQVRAHDTAKMVAEAYLASLYEAAKPMSKISPEKQKKGIDDNTVKLKIVEDPRAELINHTTLRNDLQIFEFKPGISAEFGTRGAEIRYVAIFDANGKKMLHATGGEMVQLTIEALAIKDLEDPIIGFSVKDRLGQVLFGDNTYVSYREERITVEAGRAIKANFAFQMPILPVGNYSIAVAIATGTQEDHVQHHWMHDALILKSLSSSVSTGLVGIPMQRIELDVTEAQRTKVR
jgi:lipopolysaccharide transport system ATP-binding protein